MQKTLQLPCLFRGAALPQLDDAGGTFQRSSVASAASASSDGSGGAHRARLSRGDVSRGGSHRGARTESPGLADGGAAAREAARGEARPSSRRSPRSARSEPPTAAVGVSPQAAHRRAQIAQALLETEEDLTSPSVEPQQAAVPKTPAIPAPAAHPRRDAAAKVARSGHAAPRRRGGSPGPPRPSAALPRPLALALDRSLCRAADHSREWFDPKRVRRGSSSRSSSERPQSRRCSREEVPNFDPVEDIAALATRFRERPRRDGGGRDGGSSEAVDVSGDAESSMQWRRRGSCGSSFEVSPWHGEAPACAPAAPDPSAAVLAAAELAEAALAAAAHAAAATLLPGRARDYESSLPPDEAPAEGAQWRLRHRSGLAIPHAPASKVAARMNRPHPRRITSLTAPQIAPM
ncbi:hypothetical protein M885DRAFT_298557 [Pelagophyceae sp. CCMP2097]|nr:hypothetical protein M885DRAFT_298557 [Pelagophyceae sp. CCMP2097]